MDVRADELVIDGKKLLHVFTVCRNNLSSSQVYFAQSKERVGYLLQENTWTVDCEVWVKLMSLLGVLRKPLSDFLQVVSVAQQDVFLRFGLLRLPAGTLNEGCVTLIEHVGFDVVMLPHFGLELVW